jgi:hypothetical protein
MINLISDFSSNYQEDPIFFIGFEKYLELGKDCYLYVGGQPHNSIFEKKDLPKFFFSTEEQTWSKDSTDKYVPHVNKIFTICPSKITNRDKRKDVFFPIDENMIPTKWDKEYDIVYAGYANAGHVAEIVSILNDYNYRYISFSQNGMVTNVGVTYSEKLDILSKCKISLIHNLAGNGTPQLKSRAFESAATKSIILCKKDEWNIIEDWFEEGKDFLYFISTEDLKEKINHILSNYEEYQFMIDNAYNKLVNNYTTKHFVEKYLS